MSTVSLAHSRAEQALRQSALPPLRKLAVEETEVHVILSGSVGCYYHKQQAQEAVMPHVGKRALVNRVRVVAPEGE